jgi:hypothetical protein
MPKESVKIRGRNFLCATDFVHFDELSAGRAGFFRLKKFVSSIDAARAYNEAAIKYHGEFASLNLSILTKPSQSPIPLRFLQQWFIIVLGCIARLVKPVRLRSERVVGRAGIADNFKQGVRCR